jgi:hypothetical protein
MFRMRRCELAGVLALLVACALTAGSATSFAAVVKPTRPATDTMAPPQPPDGKWLRDAEGREYFAQKIDLPAGSPLLWLDAEKTRARIAHGLEVEVLAHDEQTLTIKVYRVDDAAPARTALAPPTEKEKRAVADSYRVVATRGRRLKLTAIDDGLPTRGQWRNGFAVADVDGDGNDDIVFGPPRKSRRPPVVFRSDGAGHWTVWPTRFPSLPFDYGDAAVGDLNGDGHADVVLASHLRGIVAMIGDGKGVFEAWSKGIDFGLPGDKAATASFTSRAITIADWNRDGRPDVIALGEGPQFAIAPGSTAVQRGSRGIAIYLNGGDGSWTKVAEPGSGSFGSTLAVADVNGDGLLDVVTGSERRGFKSLLNLGQPDGRWRETEIAELRPDAIFRAVAVGDFDRDGKPDIAVGFLAYQLGVERRGIDVLLARDGGWERKTLLAEESQVGIGALATGDVDGDGALDLIAVDAEGKLSVFRGDGRGGFASAPVDLPAVKEKCAGFDVHVAKSRARSIPAIIASFADEGEVGPTGGAPACPSQGSVRAWRAGD